MIHAEQSIALDYVCPECFADPWLREHVADQSTYQGDCPSCGSLNKPLLPVDQLYDEFHNLISPYERDENQDPIEYGSPIIQIIQDQWNIFSDTLLDQNRQDIVFESIVNSRWDDDSGESKIGACDRYFAILWSHEPLNQIWEEFAQRVRYDWTQQIKFRDDLFDQFLIEEELFGQRLVNLPARTQLYRARLGFQRTPDGIKPYAGSNIGAPPRERAGPGRANPGEKVVLYTGEQEKTAVAEMRPAKGEYVSVANAYAMRNLRILDLATRPEPPNPWTDENLKYWMEFTALLKRFGKELEKPLRARDDTNDYIPSQKLAERIENAGADGIRYPSALHSGGTNVVLFDPTKAEIGESRVVEICEIHFDYRDIEE